MSEPAESLRMVKAKRARKGQLNSAAVKWPAQEFQLSLFPTHYDISKLVIACEITSQHLFGLDKTFNVLNELYNFDRNRLTLCLERSGVSEAELRELSRVYDGVTKSTLSKLMLVLSRDTR